MDCMAAMPVVTATSSSETKCYKLTWEITNFLHRFAGIDEKVFEFVCEAKCQNTTWQLKIVQKRGRYDVYYCYSLRLSVADDPCAPLWVVYHITLPKCFRMNCVPKGYKDLEIYDKANIMPRNCSTTGCERAYPYKYLPEKLLAKRMEIEDICKQHKTNTLTVICTINTMFDKHYLHNLPVTVPTYSDLHLRLYEAVKERSFSDCSVVVKDKEFRVHKAILSVRSPVFATMFTDSTEKPTVIHIDDIGSNVIEEMLTYIYTGEAPNISKDDMAIQLLHIADKYQLDRLKEMCEESLVKTLTIFNAAELFKLASTHSAKQLREASLQQISLQWQDFMKMKEWKDLKSDFEFVKELLTMITKLENPPEGETDIMSCTMIRILHENLIVDSKKEQTDLEDISKYSY